MMMEVVLFFGGKCELLLPSAPLCIFTFALREAGVSLTQAQ